MAIVDLNNNEWINSDGLKVYFGNDTARSNRGGEYSQLDSGRHCVEVTVNLAQLVVADETIVADNVTLPAGALIEQVDLLVTKAATSGGSPTLDIGLVRQDFTTQISGANGLVAGETLATLALGSLISHTAPVAGTDGALIGTVLTNTGYITAGAGTTTFTAGTVRVRIYFVMPPSADL